MTLSHRKLLDWYAESLYFCHVKRIEHLPSVNNSDLFIRKFSTRKTN